MPCISTSLIQYYIDDAHIIEKYNNSITSTIVYYIIITSVNHNEKIN